MKKYVWLLLISLLPGYAMADTFAQFQQQAELCQDLNCVRGNIDEVDAEMVVLLGKRLAYVQRAGQIKGRSAGLKPVHDQVREDQIINRIAQQAIAVGYPPIIARAVFGVILAQANIYEASVR